MNTSRNPGARKVLVLRTQLLPYSETFVKEQVAALRTWRPNLAGFVRVPGLDLDGPEPLLFGDDGATTGGKLRRWLGLPPAGAVASLRAVGAELAHVHFGVDAVAFWPILRRLDLPVLVTLHGFDVNIRPDWWGAHGSFFERRYPARLRAMAADPRVHFIAVSKALADSAVAFGLPAERIAVQYIGIDTEKFRPGPVPVSRRRRRILFVGRFVEKKGGGVLIRAFARVKAVLPDAELVMVGDGPLWEAWTAAARALDVPVGFPGSLPPDLIAAQLAEARVFCLPSLTAGNGDAEGFGLVLLEAQAAGMPVVSSARGGAQEGLVDGGTGFAFPEGDADALAAALIRVLADDQLAERLAKAAPRFVAERFDLKVCTAALERLYDAVAAGGSRG